MANRLSPHNGHQFILVTHHAGSIVMAIIFLLLFLLLLTYVLACVNRGFIQFIQVLCLDTHIKLALYKYAIIVIIKRGHKYGFWYKSQFNSRHFQTDAFAIMRQEMIINSN